MDLAAVAVPAGFRRDGLPFGVSLIGPAFSDAALLDAGVDRFRRRRAAARAAVDAPGLHPRRRRRRAPHRSAAQSPAHRARRASGEDVPHVAATTASTRSPTRRRPSRASCASPASRVRASRSRVWAVPEQHFGSFVAGVPPPLGIGSVQLDDRRVGEGLRLRARRRRRRDGDHGVRRLEELSRRGDCLKDRVPPLRELSRERDRFRAGFPSACRADPRPAAGGRVPGSSRVSIGVCQRQVAGAAGRKRRFHRLRERSALAVLSRQSRLQGCGDSVGRRLGSSIRVASGTMARHLDSGRACRRGSRLSRWYERPARR